MNAHAFRWQDVRARREKLSLFSILFVKCNYCRKYQEAADKASSTRLLYGQIIIIMRLFHKGRLPAFPILSRDHRDCLFILLVEPRSKFNKSRGKSRFSVCVCMCHFLLLRPEIHIIKSVKELAVENATVPPLINEGNQRDRRRHCRGLLDDVTLSTFPRDPLCLAFFFVLFFSLFLFLEDKDTLHDLPQRLFPTKDETCTCWLARFQNSMTR